ncbi:MAG: hypothetical protein ABI222_04695 [Opitutaceae bacterium]
MKIQFTTTLGDIWFALIYRTATNVVVISIITAGATFLTWSNPHWSFSAGEPFRYTLLKMAYFFGVHLFILCMAGFVGISLVVPFMFRARKGAVGLHELETQDGGIFELTDVTRSLTSYSVVGNPERVFGLWMLPVGRLIFTFRAKRVTMGDSDIFIQSVADRKKANQLSQPTGLSGQS